eukprot:gnl/MRDRNA2_/MRDRNA2_107450_c0_seq1.p1 gnl/MRDRNA2_/MRDRNA2_107450_c0~~gnl/MRDRNA2_/MRDRNA2_107450_c0_seq1.p1  ORF type:complete len:366 (-),score=97.80 gnl/MRDRNA2_/MRDRNA2_107450_c0_seq1:186-1121(-)
MSQQLQQTNSNPKTFTHLAMHKFTKGLRSSATRRVTRVDADQFQGKNPTLYDTEHHEFTMHDEVQKELANLIARVHSTRIDKSEWKQGREAKADYWRERANLWRIMAAEWKKHVMDVEASAEGRNQLQKTQEAAAAEVGATAATAEEAMAAGEVDVSKAWIVAAAAWDVGELHGSSPLVEELRPLTGELWTTEIIKAAAAAAKATAAAAQSTAEQVAAATAFEGVEEEAWEDAARAWTEVAADFMPGDWETQENAGINQSNQQSQMYFQTFDAISLGFFVLINAFTFMVVRKCAQHDAVMVTKNPLLATFN